MKLVYIILLVFKQLKYFQLKRLERENIKDIGFIESLEPSVKRLVPTSSQKVNQFPSITDEGDVENLKQIPKGYDPKFYENLEVCTEVKEILQYITK